MSAVASPSASGSPATGCRFAGCPLYDAASSALAGIADDAIAFGRTCVRAALRKRLCDCGHWVDGSLARDQLYRYQVWKLRGERELRQRTDCEPCSRVDARY